MNTMQKLLIFITIAFSFHSIIPATNQQLDTKKTLKNIGIIAAITTSLYAAAYTISFINTPKNDTNPINGKEKSRWIRAREALNKKLKNPTIFIPITAAIASSMYYSMAFTTKAPNIIKGEKVTLKAFKEDDFDDYKKAISPEILKSYYFTNAKSSDEIKNELTRKIDDHNSGKWVTYAIFDNNDNKLVGSIELRDSDHCGHLGIWVNEKYHGKKLAQEALKLTADTYFNINPEINSFTSSVRKWNDRSYKFHKKCGFEEITQQKDDSYFFKMSRQKVACII